MGVDTAVLQQDLVYAGLDGILTTVPLDLCAYLHAGAESGPQLYMRRPDLAAMDPAAAFDLFTALRHTLEAGRTDDVVITIAGFNALAITTQSTTSSGLHVAGRRGGAMTEDEQRVVSGLARSLGAACHALDAAAAAANGSPSVPAPATPLRIDVTIADRSPAAEVTVASAGEVLTGRATDTSPVRAVILAVLDALGSTAQVGRAGEGRIGQDPVLVVELAGADGWRALGVAEVGDDVLLASAWATVDALSRPAMTAKVADVTEASERFRARRPRSA